MAGFKKSPNAKPIINITIDDELLKQIEDYQFENRIKNRSQAINELIRKGMLDIDDKENEGR